MGLLELAIGALIIALIAGALGYSEVAAGATVVAKMAFGIFLFIALLLFLLVALGVSLAFA